MKTTVPLAAFAAVCLLVVSPSDGYAGCIGSDSFQTCNDLNGNSYTVQRFGNTTIMNGRNSRTGSSWSQNSQTFGNTTFHSGQTNGNTWNMQQHNFGNVQSFSGTNSQGQPFNYSCMFGSCN